MTFQYARRRRCKLPSGNPFKYDYELHNGIYQAVKHPYKNIHDYLRINYPKEYRSFLLAPKIRETYLELESLGDQLNWAIYFESTPEGHTFWMNIRNNLYKLERDAT